MKSQSQKIRNQKHNNQFNHKIKKFLPQQQILILKSAHFVQIWCIQQKFKFINNEFLFFLFHTKKKKQRKQIKGKKKDQQTSIKRTTKVVASFSCHDTNLEALAREFRHKFQSMFLIHGYTRQSFSVNVFFLHARRQFPIKRVQKVGQQKMHCQ